MKKNQQGTNLSKIKIYFTFLFLLTGGLFVNQSYAAPFTGGNIVVCRVGTGAAALANTGTAVFVDEYTTAGVLVQSIALPTVDSGANQILTASGTATSECQITRSTDSRYLIITGYDAAEGTAAVAGTTSAAIARVIGRIDSAGVINTSTTTTGFSANNIRSATSDNGTNLWAVGGNTGVVYTTLGGTGAGTIVNNTQTNYRVTNIFGGQLYFATGAGTIRLGTVGTGLPTTAGQTITTIPNFPTAAGSYYGYFFADLDSTVVGIDTLYTANDGAAVTPATATSGGIAKFSLVGGNWTYNGTFPANGATVPQTAFFGLTGSVVGTTVSLFASRNSNQLVGIVDATGYNVAPTAVPTSLATAATNTAIRGVALAPLTSTAANASISGRVSSSGRGISRTMVMLSGGNLEEPLYTTTNSFGNYAFNDIAAGESYVVTVMSKKYNFPNSSLIVTLNENVSDADFTAEEF